MENIREWILSFLLIKNNGEDIKVSSLILILTKLIYTIYRSTKVINMNKSIINKYKYK